MSPDFRGESGEMCELLHTSLVVQKMNGRAGRPKNNGVLEEQPVTAVTSSEAGSVAGWSGGRYGSTPTPPWVFCSCRSGQALASTSTTIRACPRHYIPPNERRWLSKKCMGAHGVQKIMGYSKSNLRRPSHLPTPEAWHAARAVDMEAPPHPQVFCSCRSGQALA